jgi:hypothetical protein
MTDIMGKTFIKEVHCEPGSIEVVVQSPMAIAIAEWAVDVLGEHSAENYVEIGLYEAKTNQHYTLVIQKSGKQTPHQMRQKAETERDALTLKLERALAERDAVAEELRRVVCL